MASAKIAVTIERELLEELDRWVSDGEYPNRSRAVQAGITRLKRERSRKHRLLGALAMLDPIEERALAEERFVADVPWPAS